MKHITIFRDKEIYASHASACQAANGDVLVAFRKAPFEHVFAHVHPESSVGLIRSGDSGKIWDVSNTATVMDPGDEVNINDPSLTTLSDGTILLTAFTLPCPRNTSCWGDKAKPVRGNTYYYVPDEQRIIVSRSFDNGITWDAPVTIDTSFYGTHSAGVFASVVEMSDGRILLPITVHEPESGISKAALICSRDKGRTWGPYSVITTWRQEETGHAGFGLPSVISYGDGQMLAVGWSVGKSMSLICFSNDDGLTWSQPEPVDTHGDCMHLCLTSRGTAIMSYGHRHPPYGVRIIPGYDGGRTWNTDRICELRGDGAMRDLGYPWTIQLSDGRLMCVYYFNAWDEDKSYYDEAASLVICKEWQLNPELYTYKSAGLRFIGATFFTEDEIDQLAERSRSDSGNDDHGPTLI